uniref:Sushi domain-containing protein n=1 Tax=Tetraodon nigroviridis TaxID=99883 RepID=H3C398_TETNG
LSSCYIQRLIMYLFISFPTFSAQIGAGSCRPPQLANGYYSPEAGFYDRGDQIVYSCEKGHKPAAEGWWGTSLCQDGTWFPKPQCIDERACLPPEIPHSTFPASAPTWYPHERKTRITCDNGFQLQNFEATALCENGSWSSLPVCTKSAGACGEPPQVPHAVVVNQVPQEVFPEDSKVRYQCKDGYEMEGEADERMFIYCMSGNWTEPPTCVRLHILEWFQEDVSNTESRSLRTKDENDLYKEGEVIRVSCDPGYQHQNNVATTKCINGTWSSVPVCV